MKRKHATKGRLLVAELKKRPHTYLEMLSYGISTSPWKRVKEALKHMEGWRLDATRKNRQGLVLWRVVKA